MCIFQKLSEAGVADLKISKFMLSVYDTIQCEKEVLQKLGICSLSDSQYHCLLNITTASLYECLKLFIHWVDYGYYEYCTMPQSLKDEMTESDVKDVTNIVGTAGDDAQSMISEMDGLLQATDHCQDYLCQQASQPAEMGCDVNTFLQVLL